MVTKKKPFKETKLGNFLANKAPHVLNAVGDLLPDAGVIGIVKRIISNDISLSKEDRMEFEKLAREHEREMATLEVQDRSSARTRETEMAKATGHVDWMMYFVGLIGLSAFVFILWVLVYEELTEGNRDLFIHAIGMVEGVAISIFSYYFGSSKGSHDKSKMLSK